MARRFLGEASSGGYVAVQNVPTYTQTSWVFWLYFEGAGGQSAGRLFQNEGSLERIITPDSTHFHYIAPWTGVGEWSILPTTNTWVHIVITYDGSTTANAPLIYMNGASQSVSTVATPTGTLTLTPGQLGIGNRISLDTTLQSRLAEFAQFSRVLTPSEVAIIAKNGLYGFSPTLYLPLYGRTPIEPDLSSNNKLGRLSNTVQSVLDPPPLLRQPYRPNYPRPEWFIPAQPSVPTIGLQTPIIHQPPIFIQTW